MKRADFVLISHAAWRQSWNFDEIDLFFMVVTPPCRDHAEQTAAPCGNVLGGTKLMKRWRGRHSPGSRYSVETRYSVDVDPSSDVFRQTEKSLLGEAFSRPLGVGALLVLVLAIGMFAANHFMWSLDRVGDYALVAFFVSGGILLSLLLRAGEPRVANAQRVRPKREPLIEDELQLGNAAAIYPTTSNVRPLRPGFAEDASPSGVPVPAAATAAIPLTVDPEQDDEVAGYERALLHYAERGDLHGQGEILRRLGHTAKSRGHLSESREFYVNSRNCFKETADHYAEAAVLLDLGQVLESLGDHDAASAAYRDANRALLDVAMNTSNRDGSIHAQAAD
jgi:hypothetical protein